jgi:hypothetical protein
LAGQNLLHCRLGHQGFGVITKDGQVLLVGMDSVSRHIRSEVWFRSNADGT